MCESLELVGNYHGAVVEVEMIASIPHREYHSGQSKKPRTPLAHRMLFHRRLVTVYLATSCLVAQAKTWLTVGEGLAYSSATG